MKHDVPDARRQAYREIGRIKLEATLDRDHDQRVFARYERNIALFAASFLMFLLARVAWAWWTGAFHF